MKIKQNGEILSPEGSRPKASAIRSLVTPHMELELATPDAAR